MESDPVFASDDEAIRYWKQKATDSMNDFNELQEMSGDYERELDAQINRLEEEKKNSISQCKRLQDEIEKYHAKNTEREAEIDRLLKELKHETSQKEEFTRQNRILEQELDDYDRKYRQIYSSYEEQQELLSIEQERQAILETEVCEKTKLEEIVQRLKDEKRDLKSEIEVKEKLHKRDKENEIIETNKPSDLESRRAVGEGGVASVPHNSVSSRSKVSSFGDAPGQLSLKSETRLTPCSNGQKSPSSTLSSPTPSISSHSNSSSQSRLSALSIVGDLLRKVGALETKLASCRTFVRDNSTTINSQVSTTPRRTSTENRAQNIYTTPTSRAFSSRRGTPGQTTPTANNGQSPHEQRIGERLANQRALFHNGTPGERLQPSKTIKLISP